MLWRKYNKRVVLLPRVHQLSSLLFTIEDSSNLTLKCNDTEEEALHSIYCCLRGLFHEIGFYFILMSTYYHVSITHAGVSSLSTESVEMRQPS